MIYSISHERGTRFCYGLLCCGYIIIQRGMMHYIYPHSSWWRHQMETFSALLAVCAGNSPLPVNSPHKGQWRGALMFSLICAWINAWVNDREAGDLGRHRAHYDTIIMSRIPHWHWCKHFIKPGEYEQAPCLICHFYSNNLFNVSVRYV